VLRCSMNSPAAAARVPSEVENSLRLGFEVPHELTVPFVGEAVDLAFGLNLVERGVVGHLGLAGSVECVLFDKVEASLDLLVPREFGGSEHRLISQRLKDVGVPLESDQS